MQNQQREEREIQPPNRQKALEWITALSAAGLDYRLSRGASGWILHVPGEQAGAAYDTIRSYEEENVGWPPSKRAAVDRGTRYDAWTAFWISGFLVVFFIWLGPYAADNPVLRAACMDAVKVTTGEWWRVFTALTIHSGFTHVAANAVFFVIFGTAVCRTMGGGIGSILVLATGVMGNAAVAWLVETQHTAVGASTACFGALGILSIDQAVDNYRRTHSLRSIWSRTWIPLCAGLALLGFLGTSPGSDLPAHGFGFAFGLVLGFPLSLLGTAWLPAWGQRALELAALLAVMFAWGFAFEAAGVSGG